MRNLEHINIEITKNCNQNCFYCFNDSGNSMINKSLSTSKWLGILKLLKSKGLKSVHFTGGEPFIYPEIMTIIKGSLQLELETSVLSNGYKIKEYTEKYPKILSKLSVAQISLDSTKPIIHNKRRRYENAWNDAIEAIFALDSLGVPIEISSTVDNETISEIKNLVDFSLAHNFKLIIRPLINTGRALMLQKDSMLKEKIKNELERIDSNEKISLVTDRFKYVSFYELQNQYLPKESFSFTTINQFNVFNSLSKYVDISSVL